MKRITPWPLERAQLARLHATSLKEERDRADAAVAAAHAAVARARADAVETLGRWHADNKDFVEMLYDDIKRELSQRAGGEIARNIETAWREIEPHERVKKHMLNMVMSRKEIGAHAMDETTSVLTIRIPPVEFRYATDLRAAPGFPWAGRRALTP